AAVVEAEPPPPMEPESPPADASVRSIDARQVYTRGRSKNKDRPKPSGREKYKAESNPDSKPSEPPTPEPTTIAGPNAPLPCPTASPVTVHIPAIGEAVLYQHMLLPEGEALTVHLEARRHKPSKKRKSK